MVRIADQRILVAWDPQTKVEHFVREAGFKQPRRIPAAIDQLATGDQAAISPKPPASKDQDFGFLVPTPTQPSIESCDGAVFGRLTQRIAPRIEQVQKWEVSPMPLIFAPFALSSQAQATRLRVDSPAAMKNSVEVLETKQVAGYDVAVLKADDAGALAQWLKDHDYEARPALEQWAEPYVAKGWIITAFKYAAQAGRIEAGAVRMSFVTDEPIFPYRVPSDQIADSDQQNLLQTHLIGPGRASGLLGDGDASHPWAQARLKYARPIPNEELADLLGNSIPQEAIAALAGSWLTTYDDRSWPSGTEDLRFQFDSNAGEYQEVKRVVVRRVVPIPLDVVFLVAITGTILVRRRWRQAK